MMRSLLLYEKNTKHNKYELEDETNPNIFKLWRI